jgi:peptidoglycan-associated lipoprotein
MSLSKLLVGALLVAVAAGCSHEQKAAPRTPRVAAAAPAPARKPVSSPPPAEAIAAAPAKTDDAIFFDFDSSLIRSEARPVLQEVAETVRKADRSVRIEGNCDELGTIEYNLALGEHRARAAKDYLVHLGVPSARIATVSFGSQKPKYDGHDDEARAKNRRDDLVVR